MLRSELLDGMRNVLLAIEDSGLQDAIMEVAGVAGGRMQKDPAASAVERLLHAFYIYDSRSRDFGGIEKEIVTIAGFEKISDIPWRARIMTSTTTDPHGSVSAAEHELIYPVVMALRVFREYFPRIIGLLRRESESESYKAAGYLIEGGEGHDPKNTVDVLTLILPEPEGNPSSSSRVYSSLQAISDLYGVVATLRKNSKSEIYIVSCDSGSSKVFDFKGLGSVIREVKDLILTIWDRTIAYRRYEYADRISAIKDTLPLVSSISKMAEDGALSREEAHILTRTLLTSVVCFVENGCIIPELKLESHFEPEKMLQAREMLLLSSDKKNGQSSEKPQNRAKRSRPRSDKSSPKAR